MRSLQRAKGVAAYAELFKRVRQTLILGQERIERGKGALDIVLKFE